MNHLLLVCIGNICRSPMAEAILQNALPAISVRSAGIGALIGKPAEPFARELMLEKGLDISSHRGQQISQNLCNWADVILVMDLEQRKYIEDQYPLVRGKVFRLGDPLKKDIPDPYRQGKNSFKSALELIEASAGVWVDRIKNL